jgi:hypothetical protein
MTIPLPFPPKTWFHMQSALHANFGKTGGKRQQQNEDTHNHKHAQ